MSGLSNSNPPASTAKSNVASTSNSKPSAPTNDEIDKLLSREATAVSRDVEVERILKAFKLNPFEVLDISALADEQEIKKRYKQLSLLIHPDKATHPRAQDAFDLLKKAESELSDAEKRANLQALITSSRNELLKSLQLPLTTKDDHPKLQNMTPSWKEQLKEKVKATMIDDELRRRRAVKLAMANEGREAMQKEQEVESRKRKAEEDKAWEESREQRVDSWRNFSSSSGGGGTKKRKKQKLDILG